MTSSSWERARPVRSWRLNCPPPAFGAFAVGGMVHGYACAFRSQGRHNPSADAFGGARHYRRFVRQSAHSSPVSSIRLTMYHAKAVYRAFPL